MVCINIFPCLKGLWSCYIKQVIISRLRVEIVVSFTKQCTLQGESQRGNFSANASWACWSNAGLSLAHRLRRWTNIILALGQRVVFAGKGTWTSGHQEKSFLYQGSVKVEQKVTWIGHLEAKVESCSLPWASCWCRHFGFIQSVKVDNSLYSSN